MNEQLGMGVPRVINDDELMREWFRFFGTTSGVRLLGWCTATMLKMAALGVEPRDEQSLIDHGWGARTTRYRNVKHLRDLKQDLTDRGLMVRGDEDEGRSPAPLIQAVAS